MMILKSELKQLDIYNIKINTFLFFGYSINIKNEKILRVSMLLERNLTIFDYKVIFAIGMYMRLSVLDQLWSVDLSIKISEIKYKESEEFNPNGLWLSEIRSVIRAMDYYMLDNDFQTNINYRIILWVWYVNFFWIILFWIVIPITSKDEWGHGCYFGELILLWGYFYL